MSVGRRSEISVVYRAGKRTPAEVRDLERASFMKPSRLKWPAAYDLSCSPDGQHLVCVGRNVVMIDLSKRQRVWTSHPVSHPSHAEFSPDGEALAVKTTSGRIIIVDPYSGAVVHDHRNQKEGEGSGVCFSPDGAFVVDGSWNGILTIRSTCDGAVVSREHFPGDMITRVTHDQNRSTWLVEHSPRVRPGENAPLPEYVSVRRWPFSPETTRTFSFGVHMQAATLSPDGSRICYIQKWDERRVHVAQTSDGQILTSSKPIENGGAGSKLAWSADGRYVAAASTGMFLIFRTSDLEIVGQFACQYPSSMAFLSNEQEIAFGSWNTSTVVKLSDILAHAPPVQ